MAIHDDDDPTSVDDDDGGSQIAVAPDGSSVTTLFLQRGSRVATRGAKHAAVGTMTVGGHTFDTFERLDGFVCLPEGQFFCKMEKSSKKTKYDPEQKKIVPRLQLRPDLSGVEKWKNKKRGWPHILIHPGETPGSFIGCVGVGKYDNGKRLEDSVVTMNKLIRLCGGYKRGRVVRLVVKGTLPPTP